MPAHLRFSAPFLASLTIAMMALAPSDARAGGPRYIAGATYFNSSVAGQSLRWAGGKVSYYVDQGPLSSTVSNQQATAMIDAAAALWASVSTAGVTLTQAGSLNEDVSGSNIQVDSSGQITTPADATPSATNSPVAVVFDYDGSVIDAIFGATTSAPSACQNSGVFFWIDNFNRDATITHAVILLNGLCATNSAMLDMMSFQVERAFGSILGLGFSQVNPDALIGDDPTEAQAWPVMQPASGACGSTGGNCIPNPAVLSLDDIAALNRLYPLTASNLVSFPGKKLTAPNTISIRGTISFETGYGMQGVNVVARPLDASGNPLDQYAVTAVSGGLFSGNHGNPITGYDDASGAPLSMWGSSDASLQGAFDLSGLPLPPGITAADYEITFEAVDPLDILENYVGPYALGQVEPSGTLGAVTLRALAAGSSQTVNVTASRSAVAGYSDAIGSEAQPGPISASGFWCGRLSQAGQTDWFTFPVRGNRLFTIVTQAIDESGSPSNAKAMPALGVWDAFDPVGANAVGAAPALNGLATGETWLRVATRGDDIVRLGIADQRGDGRPDYAYNGWILYADTVSPQRLPASGGPIVIRGMGFRIGDTVLVGGQPALVTSISPNEITAIAPAAAAGITGSVDVEVDDGPLLYAAAILPGGISYDSGTGDALTLNTAPMNTVPIGEPLPFTVTALGPDLSPAAGVRITYTVTAGTATLGCGLAACTVAASGDGRATMNVTATNSTSSIVTASLANGSSLQAHFAGGTPPALAALTPQLSVAAGATVTWTVQAIVLSNGVPVANQSVAWQTQVSGIAAQGSAAALTNAAGIATQTLTVGPLTKGQTVSINACLNGTSQCVAFAAFGARSEYAALRAVSGVGQSLSSTATPAQVVLRVLDIAGDPMAGATVALYQALYAWTPPCQQHSLCVAGTLLATQSGTATSAIDGTVVFAPATLPGVATRLQGLAASGNTASASISIEQHP
jgi:hypothetical protein